MADPPRLLLWGVPQLHAGSVLVFTPERRFQLLALLALAGGEWVAREQAAALLWPERGAAQARRNLRHVVFNVRALDGAAALETSDHALRWPVRTDLLDFDHALREHRLADAVALRRGAPLCGLDDPRNEALGTWLAAERERIDARWHQAALQRLAALTDPRARNALAQQLLQLDPLDEAALAARIEVALELGHGAQAQQAYRDYRARLADELGVEPSRRLRELVRDAAAPVAQRAGETSASSDAFVGRRVELRELCARLGQPDGRLVTLLGPGGIGKSRLAREALVQLRSAFAGGAWWVELQDLDDLAAASARLGQQIGVDADALGDPLPRIALRLANTPALVVFDNAEHLARIGGLCERLLAAVPSLTLLLTSRTRTHAAHERVIALDGLAVPEADSRDLEAAAAFDAVRLFEARARAVQPGFELARHLDAVIAIVEAVGGAPLAIELSAAWVRLLPPREIARELRASLLGLEHDPALPGPHARPEHRSVPVVLGQTWALLAPAERAALDALSVFHGGFAVDAARQVAEIALPLLSSLVDQSVVGVDAQGRFGLHPLLAAFAAERMHGDPQRTAALADRHALFYASLLGELAPHARADHRLLVARVDAEFANARRAWNHALATGQSALVARMAPVWRSYFDVQGRYEEGIALMQPVLDWPERDADAQRAIGAVRDALAVLLTREGDLQRAQAVAEAGVGVAERCGDRRALVGCLASVGSCHMLRGRTGAARPLFERALALAREDGQRAELAALLTNLGVCAKREGRFDEALAHYAEALAIDREAGHHEAIARRLNNIGNVHMERGDAATAREVMAQGLQHCAHYRIASMQPYFEAALGILDLERGALDQAEQHLRRADELAGATATMTIRNSVLCQRARLALRRGRAGEALQHLRAAARGAQAAGADADVLDAALHYGAYLRDAGLRVDAARVWQMVQTHPLTEAGMRDSARQWLEALALDPDERALCGAEPTTLAAVIEALFAPPATPI
ncbi:MAG: tetratricopeptide repeat protein [Ideonella sp.]|nr:tetratricopeptide repeat protein [Ideonella sp.]